MSQTVLYNINSPAACIPYVEKLVLFYLTITITKTPLSKALRLRGHLQTEICTLNVIMTLRGWGGCARDAKH